MKTITKFILNNQTVSTANKPQSSLLDFIRNDQHLHGTKEVCREGDCGACTVLIGELVEGELKYHSVNSCIYPLGNVEGRHVVTIEGLNNDDLSFVQKEFVDNHASQCGFCTPGFINSFTNYLINSDNLNYDDAKDAVAGNICRCTGYASILRAVDSSLANLARNNFSNQLQQLVDKNIIPEYFLGIKQRLLELNLSDIKLSNYENDIFVGGGTDLMVQKEDYLQKKKVHLTINEPKQYISEDENLIHVSGITTFESFKNSEIIYKYFPRLKNQLELLASLPIRSSATIAGNIVNASPIADLTILLLALNAKVVYENKDETNTISLRNLYSSYKQLSIPQISFIKEFYFIIPKINSQFNFEKVSKRNHLDIASVNTAMFISVSEDKVIEDISITAGGVSPIPLYLKNTSGYLTNKQLNSENIKNAIKLIDEDISPISDIRGSKQYKTLLLKQLIKAHFIELFPDVIQIENLL